MIEIVASSPHVKIIEGKRSGEHWKWHAKCAESQLVVTVGQVEKPSDGSVKTSDGMENGAGDSAWRVCPAVPNALSAITAVAAAPQSVGDCEQPPSML